MALALTISRSADYLSLDKFGNNMDIQETVFIDLWYPETWIPHELDTSCSKFGVLRPWDVLPWTIDQIFMFTTQLIIITCMFIWITTLLLLQFHNSSPCFFFQCFFRLPFRAPSPGPQEPHARSRAQQREWVFEKRSEPRPSGTGLRSSSELGTVQAAQQRSAEGPVDAGLREVGFCWRSPGEIGGETNPSSTLPLPLLPYRRQTEQGNTVLHQEPTGCRVVVPHKPTVQSLMKSLKCSQFPLRTICSQNLIFTRSPLNQPLHFRLLRSKRSTLYWNIKQQLVKHRTYRRSIGQNSFFF